MPNKEEIELEVGKIKFDGIWASNCHICYQEATSFRSIDGGETWFCDDCNRAIPPLHYAVWNRILVWLGRKRVRLN